MLAATGSTMTAATRSSSCGTTLYGTTNVLATALAGTPAVPGRPNVATPLPPAAKQRVGGAVKVAVEDHQKIAAGVPAGQPHRRAGGLGAEFISRTMSQLGTRSVIASASSISPGVGAP